VAAASCPCCDEEPPTRAHGELDIVQINCLLYNKLLNPILKGEAQAATQGYRLHIVSPFASPRPRPSTWDVRGSWHQPISARAHQDFLICALLPGRLLPRRPLPASPRPEIWPLLATG
jgi:hypothetical protein